MSPRSTQPEIPTSDGSTPVGHPPDDAPCPADEFARASLALQEMVDALATMTDLNQFIPRALSITAHAFRSGHCSYFEHRGTDPIRLVHRFLGDKVLTREEIIAAYDQDPEYIDALLNGFTVDDSYFGIPFRERLKTTVIDHSDPNRTSTMDRYCLSRGWMMELNVPLMIAGKAAGALVIERGLGCSYTPHEIVLAERLGQQFALALELNRLTIEAERTAAARERERAAQLRADESEKAGKALQEIVDGLAAVPELEQFIPAALQIVARQFGTDHCSYFQHRHGDPIHLEYWFLKDRVLSRNEILDLGDEFEFMKMLATGFTVEDSYFGVCFRNRTRASVIDHSLEDRKSEIDIACRAHGWILELNIPLVVEGRSEGVLVVQRGPGLAYSPDEIALGERMGQRLALAMEVGRLSEEAKHNAVVRERERAAMERADELTRFSNALRTTLDSLVCEADFRLFVGYLLQNASEQLQSEVVEYWRADDSDVARLILTCRHQQVFEGSDVEDDVRTRGIKVLPGVIGADSVPEMSTYFASDDLKKDRLHRQMFEASGFDLPQWCEERNIHSMIGLPLMRGNRNFGALCVYLSEEHTLNQAKVDVAHSFAQQLALAVRLSELAEESKQAAVLRERGVAAQERTDEIARFGEALRRTLDSLVDESDFPGFVGQLLTVASEQLQAPVVEYWKVLDGDHVALALTCRNGLIYEGSDIKNDVRTRGLTVFPELMDSPRLLERKTHYICEDLANDPWQELLYRDLDFSVPLWCAERGVQRMLNLPLLRGQLSFGALLVYLPGELHFDQPKIDVAYSFAQQLALSVRLTELAEESKQAAVSREREAVTQMRAAEFAKANAVLSSTLDRLAEERDLRSFPRTILQEAISQTDGQDGIILLYDGTPDTLRTKELVLSGCSHEEETEALSLPFWDVFKSEWWTAIAVADARIIDFETYGDNFPAETRVWHRSRGHKYLVSVPMLLNSQPYGFFGVAFSERTQEVSKVSLGLIQALAQQATLAIQLTRLAESSQQAAISLERQQVIIQERAHMAREIHDRLAQGYAAILVQQHAMRRLLRMDTLGLTQHLDIVERLSKENIAEARKTMDELRIDPLGPIDLQRSLEACIGQIKGRYSFDVTLEIEGEAPVVPHYMEVEVCRVVGEAVTNACKHSRVNSAAVVVKHIQDRFVILVCDAGVGFDAHAKTSSFGITSMYERAARAGAELTIRSTPGSGTEVMLTLGI